MYSMNLNALIQINYNANMHISWFAIQMRILLVLGRDGDLIDVNETFYANELSNTNLKLFVYSMMCVRQTALHSNYN